MLHWGLYVALCFREINTFVKFQGSCGVRCLLSFAFFFQFLLQFFDADILCGWSKAIGVNVFINVLCWCWKAAKGFILSDKIMDGIWILPVHASRKLLVQTSHLAVCNADQAVFDKRACKQKRKCRQWHTLWGIPLGDQRWTFCSAVDSLILNQLAQVLCLAAVKNVQFSQNKYVWLAN